jgi:ribosome biogenesis GTPase
MITPMGDLGYDDRWQALVADLTLPGDRPGRVVRTDTGRRLVDTGDGVLAAPDPVNRSTTGDWVLVGADGRIRAVLPRRTELRRGAGRREARAQVLAANVDVVGVVHALSAAPNAGRIERLLSLAWSSGATAVVILTKADLSSDPDGDVAEVRAISPGAEVIAVSTVPDDPGLLGVRRLAVLLAPGRTAVFVGPSGTGKSSLVNELAGRPVLATREIRNDGKGRHTSTARELVALPGGGVVIDTPGLRGVQLWDSEGVDSAFADILELAGGCRFANCSHGTEPGCAVRAAISDGRLAPRRLAAYDKLRREQQWLAMRYDARLRAEARAKWTKLGREARARARP